MPTAAPQDEGIGGVTPLERQPFSAHTPDPIAPTTRPLTRRSAGSRPGASRRCLEGTKGRRVQHWPLPSLVH